MPSASSSSSDSDATCRPLPLAPAERWLPESGGVSMAEREAAGRGFARAEAERAMAAARSSSDE